MNEHAGPACALSVLIVGVFAVLLHEKIPADASHPPTPPARAVTDARPAATKISPPATPEPRILPPKASITPRTPAPEPAPTIAPVPVAARPSSPIPTPPAPKAEARPGHAISAFTEVAAGETLVDVATRVYGSAQMAHALWKANRDLIDQPTSNLARGMLLRTP